MVVPIILIRHIVLFGHGIGHIDTKVTDGLEVIAVNQNNPGPKCWRCGSASGIPAAGGVLAGIEFAHQPDDQQHKANIDRIGNR